MRVASVIPLWLWMNGFIAYVVPSLTSIYISHPSLLMCSTAGVPVHVQQLTADLLHLTGPVTTLIAPNQPRTEPYGNLLEGAWVAQDANGW